ncbi:sulfite dehydrogenase [Acidocella sp.]|uniref:sulfite dehydrogenase n=1 Tax=Acidocella sp. TaxID=50710 RepID=UPI002D7F2451|nr:sulfite dehydrogenase [Acidocella sp.]
MPDDDRLPTQKPKVARRRVLEAGLGIAGTTVLLPHGAKASPVAGRGEAGPPGIPRWMQTLGTPVNARPYGLPSPFQAGVVRLSQKSPTKFSSASFTPLQDLHGTITPNGLFYERDHSGVPPIDPAEFRLLVDGMVERPMVFRLADLMRLPAVTARHFLECSGNTYMEWAAPVGKTVQETHGLVRCAEWSGVALKTVLDIVGVKDSAGWFVAEGGDAAALDRSIPLAHGLRAGALLAYAQNGEALRPEQGFPLRLLLPGFEGNTNVKWLRHIELRKSPAMTEQEMAYYTELLPNGKASAFNFMMQAKSVITRPSGGQVLAEPGFYEISGLAWSGNGRIASVEVSTDGGRSWSAATLQEPVQPVCFTRFRLPWRWTGGGAVLQSRAVDETGYVQPALKQLVAARGVHSFYHNNAIQSWQISAGGQVTNVHA